MLRAAIVNVQEQVQAGLRDLASFKNEVENAREDMSAEDAAMSEWVLQQVTELEERFNEILAEAHGTRMLVEGGPIGSA